MDRDSMDLEWPGGGGRLFRTGGYEAGGEEEEEAAEAHGDDGELEPDESAPGPD